MRILIAEDERVTRASLARQLTQWGHTVTAVEDGQQAWEAYGAGEFDLLMTDWEMPNVSGPELIERVRKGSRGGYTYVIILTSRTDKADVVKGIEAGADDYLGKPFDRDELRVRLLAGERIVTLERALSRQNVELRQANDRISHGLRAAARVQQSMLPSANVVNPRVTTAWAYIPTEELAGDAVGLHFVDDRYLVAYVLDVSGHGVPAALLSVSAMHALDPLPESSSLLRDLTAGADGRELRTMQRPCRIANELNARFRSTDCDGRFLTMILCVLDSHTGKLHLTRAGHPAPVVLRGGSAIDVPDDGSFPIAIVDDAGYEDVCVQLRPGDRFCFFSDGILEQMESGGNEEFGQTRLLEVLAARHGESPQAAADGVVAALRTWAGGTSFRDDVSLLVVDWHGGDH